MIEYAYGIDTEKGMRWKTYVARIDGSDPNYILHREFEKVNFIRTWYGYSCYLNLRNGLYEVAVIRIDERTRERIRRDRWWVIIVGDDTYDYGFDEMNWQYALYVSSQIKVNSGEDNPQ